MAVSATAVDTSGQRSDPSTVTIDCLDDLPPSVSLTSPAPASGFREGDTVVLEASADDDFEVTSVTFEIQGETYLDESAPYTADHVVEACPGGVTLTVLVVAEDSFGQQSQDSTLVNCLSDSNRGSAVLSVDFQVGANTQADFDAFNATQAPTAVFVTSEGDVTVELVGLRSGLSSFAFDRNALADAGEFTFANLYNDLFYDIVPGGDGQFELSLTGLVADRTYAVTFYSWDGLDGSTSTHPEVTTVYTPIGDTIGNPVSAYLRSKQLHPIGQRVTTPCRWVLLVTQLEHLTFQLSAIGTGGASGSFTFTILNGLQVAIAESGGVDQPPSVRITSPAPFGTVTEGEAFNADGAGER